ncbi:MAG: hypothetical protein JNJ73_01970 [Hyphomonadaceae bacterium]|nr:hypothetical protein [Hyphomonadaceae bacterium]
MRTQLLAAAAIACFALAGCQSTQTAAVAPPVAEAPAPIAYLDFPVNTASAEARTHFNAGLAKLDLQDNLAANREFKAAVAADPNFALAHLYVGFSGNSTEEFASNLAAARQHEATASRAEQLVIQNAQNTFDNNFDAALANTQALVSENPQSGRALILHALNLEGLNRVADARATWESALRVAPRVTGVAILAGNDYLTLAPKDFNRAESLFQQAVALSPEAGAPYDFLGDAHRAQNKLEDARRDYTMAAERDPQNGLMLQQRGHVNSFLGNYAEARADYDRAVALEDARGSNLGPTYAVYRSYVSIYEGKPDDAITELRALIARVDATNMEGKADLKNFALTNIAQIATNYGRYRIAQTAIDELAANSSAQAQATGNQNFVRTQQANVVFQRGMLAARRGQQATARRLAAQYATLVAPDANPRKLEPMHEVLGLAAFQRRDYRTAEAELAQANPNDIYVRYHRAVAQAELGQSEANATFAALAVHNFNDPNWAMVRPDVLARVHPEQRQTLTQPAPAPR